MTTSPPSFPLQVNKSPLEALLTEAEVSQLTKRSIASVRRDRLLRQGCAYVKLGALVRYRPEDVRSYIERNLQTQLPALSHRGATK